MLTRTVKQIAIDAKKASRILASLNSEFKNQALIPNLTNSCTNCNESMYACSGTLYEGCTDINASNYDPLANIDDGSCICDGFSIEVDGGAYQNEVSWTIIDCNGNMLALGGAPYSECLEGGLPENYIIILADSWGDGWNGNVMTIDGESDYTIESGFDATFIVGECGDAIYGCMDEEACNYDENATDDDGSCLTIYGCMDDAACNFNMEATCDDGSCLIVYGCMDDAACNFNLEATCDDSSCIYVDGICETCSGELNGSGIIVDGDNDDDTFCNDNDMFPDDPTEWIDTDGDGVGDNSDVCPGYDDNLDTDGDGVADGCDIFPDDPNEDTDTDGYDDMSFIAGATSGDVNLDGNLNITDIILYIEAILAD